MQDLLVLNETIYNVHDYDDLDGLFFDCFGKGHERYTQLANQGHLVAKEIVRRLPNNNDIRQASFDGVQACRSHDVMRYKLDDGSVVL